MYMGDSRHLKGDSRDREEWTAGMHIGDNRHWEWGGGAGIERGGQLALRWTDSTHLDVWTKRTGVCEQINLERWINIGRGGQNAFRGADITHRERWAARIWRGGHHTLKILNSTFLRVVVQHGSMYTGSKEGARNLCGFMAESGNEHGGSRE